MKEIKRTYRVTKKSMMHYLHVEPINATYHSTAYTDVGNKMHLILYNSSIQEKKEELGMGDKLIGKIMDVNTKAYNADPNFDVIWLEYYVVSEDESIDELVPIYIYKKAKAEDLSPKIELDIEFIS